MCQKFEFIILFLLSLSRVKTIESHCNFNTPSSPRICIFDEYKNSFVTETDNRRIHEIKDTYIHENRSQRMLKTVITYLTMIYNFCLLQGIYYMLWSTEIDLLLVFSVSSVSAMWFIRDHQLLNFLHLFWVYFLFLFAGMILLVIWLVERKTRIF